MKYQGLIFSSVLISLMLVSCDNVDKKNISSQPPDKINSYTTQIRHEIPEAVNTSFNDTELSNNISSGKRSEVTTMTEIQIRGMDNLALNDFKITESIKVDSANYFRAPIVRNPALGSFIWPYSKLSISLDNDLFCNTDRYYTNGVIIKWQSPVFAFWRINSILPLNQSDCMEYNSLELHHAMYTPFTTKVPPLLKNDRPYASTMFIRFERKTDNPFTRISQCASFDIGIIGKAALGSLLQKGVHAGLPTNDEPLGWETQIANDIVLNYNYQIIHTLTQIEHNIHPYFIGRSSLGTLNTSVTTGLGVRFINAGYYMAPLPGSLNELLKPVKSKWLLSFDARFCTSIVGYNATLNGGLLNNHSIYVLKPEEMKRLLINTEFKFEASYKNYGITIAQHYITKEFKKGKSHFWGQIGLNIGF